MSGIIKSIDVIREYSSIEYNFEFEVLKPFIVQVERDEILSVIGQEMYDSITSDKEIDKTALVLIHQAIVNISLAKYIPQGTVLIGNDGITISSGEQIKTAEWWQIRDLRKDLYDRGYSAIDGLLYYMESNPEGFEKWTSSDEYTVFDELIVSHTKDFQKWSDINNSRRVFISMKPHLEHAQEIYVNQWLNDETIQVIKNAENKITKRAKKLLHAALVNHALARAVLGGGYIFGTGSIYMQHLDLPGDKSKFLSEKEKGMLQRQKENAGDECLKLLKLHIESNIESFKGYIIKEISTIINVTDTKSIVSF